MKVYKDTWARRLAGALLAGISALLLVVGLWLLLSHLQALAQPAADTATLMVDKQANTQFAAPGARLTYTFSVEISSETTVAQIVNTAQVTGTGGLVTASETTNILSGLPPNSQIRSPNRDVVITQRGLLTISGIAWDEGIVPPYLVDDPVLSVYRQADRAYYVAWTDVVSAEHYSLQEATQPDFSDSTSSVLPASSTNQLVSKGPGEDGTYHYRVQASRYGLSPSRWSNVESVVVPWTAGSASVSSSDLSADIAANGPMTVQVCIDECVEPDGWHNAVVTATAWGGWEWSYQWSPLPEENDVQHAIHTRASSAEGVFGPTDTITVTVDNYVPPVPYAPTLNDIDNADEDGDYTVSWSYEDDDPGVPDPTSYTLQEAKNTPTDLVDVYIGSSTSRSFTDQEDGTYYYRVQGHNSYGPGAWSDMKSVTVRFYSRGLYYDFDRSFAKPAWPIRRTSLYQGDQWGGTWTEEHDGSMYALMNDKFDFAIASPWEEAPDPPYIIKTRVKVHDPANLVAYGIIFGGNEGSPCPAYRESGCLTHYYRLEVIWDGALKAGFKRIDQHESDKGHGQGRELIRYQYVTGSSGGDDWHTWELGVKPDGIDVYFDGSLFGSTSDTKYVNEPYFGVYVSANEYKPAIGRFDYYYVTPLPDAIPAEVTISGPTTGNVDVAYAFTATVSPITATQPITYAWRATGQPLVTHTGGLSDTATFAWSTPGTRAITVTAANPVGTAHGTHVIAIGDAPSPGDPYEPDDACAQASALATDGTVQSHTFHRHADVDWAHFTVVSGTTYVLQANSMNAGADLVLELYDACGGNLEGSDDAFGANARLIFTAPSGGTYYVKTLNHDPTTYGPDVTYELSVRVQPSDGVALIVAGHDDGYKLQDNILHCTNTTFRTFRRGGLDRTNLRYLSYVNDDARTDADGDGVSDVHADSSSADVETAITSWAAGLAGANVPFYLYLMDHGAIDAFLTDGSGDTITPDELDGWLTTLENATGAPVNVIYEACHSGSFIDGLKEISKPGRVIVASTGRLNNAYPSRHGALFSDAFFTQLGQSSDLYTSFLVAKGTVEATGLWQTPWLDDDGDGVPNSGDGDVARQRGLPIFGFIDRPPVIERVTPPTSIVDGDGVLRAQVRDDGDAEGLDVWAVVYPPSFEEPAPTEDGTMPDLGLPRVELSDSDGDDEYVGMYEDFTEDGAYQVVVYAQDAAGNHALPAVTTVRTRWWVNLPIVVRN